MARSAKLHRSMCRLSRIWLLAIAALNISPSEALALVERGDTCPSSYTRCGSASLPANFCCSSTSTCISLDNASSAICCPSGQSCTYIQPITCDVQLQDASAHPTNAVKTTRLNDQLPQCGNACCPFGYTCHSNNLCALDTATAANATSILPSPAATSTSSSRLSAASASVSTSTTVPTSTGTSVSTPASSTNVVSPVSQAEPASPSPAAASKASSASSSLNSGGAAVTTKRADFPTKALLAGFFPGVMFGALAALLFSLCCRRRRARKNSRNPTFKVTHHPQRSVDGTLLGISSPIPSEDLSYRTDFLLRPNAQKRGSAGARSVLQRTGTRVKSLFGSSLPKAPNGNTDAARARTPPPPLPSTPPQQTVNGAHRQPSTESIKVYSPPGVLANANFLRPEPYAAVATRPNTTFTDLMEKAGFQNSKGDPCFRVTETPKPEQQSK